MYFPYLRGRQYELLSLLDLVNKKLLGNYVIPIIEPVTLSPTLVNVIEAFVNASRPLIVIRNPGVGAFEDDMKSAKVEERSGGYKQRFLNSFDNPQVWKALIMRDGAINWLNEWLSKGIKKSEIVIINENRDDFFDFETVFNEDYPRYVLIPDQ